MLDLILGNFDLDQIANSGQCFRMNKISDNHYLIVAFNRTLEIEYMGNSYFRFYCNNDDITNIWYEYFDINTDYNKFILSIDKNDIFLQKAAQMGSGIRILKQDPWETLITFIISQRKNITAIKKSVESLCKKYGKEINDNIFSFPTPEALASSTIEELNSCSLGYRSQYILNTALDVVNNNIDLHYLNKLDDSALLSQLMTLDGVGPKVANCIMLFAYHRIAAFPIDVWITRILEKEYNNNFNINQYKGYAGVLQQYMFYYAQNSSEYKMKRK